MFFSISAFAATPNYEHRYDSPSIKNSESINHETDSIETDEELPNKLTDNVINELKKYISNYYSTYKAHPLATSIRGVRIDGTTSEFKNKLLNIGFVDIFSLAHDEKYIYGSLFDRFVMIKTISNDNDQVYMVSASMILDSDLDAAFMINKICNEFKYSTDYIPLQNCNISYKDSASEIIKKMLGKRFYYVQIPSDEEINTLTYEIKDSLIEHMPSYKDSITISFLAKCIVNSLIDKTRVHRSVSFELLQQDEFFYIDVNYYNLLNE